MGFSLKASDLQNPSGDSTSGITNVQSSGVGTNLVHSATNQNAVIKGLLPFGAIVITNGPDGSVVIAANAAAVTNVVASASGSNMVTIASGVATIRGLLPFGSIVITNGPGGSQVIAADAGSGENNTATNLGSGIGIFRGKNGVVLDLFTVTNGAGPITSQLLGSNVVFNFDGSIAFNSAGMTNPPVTLTNAFLKSSETNIFLTAGSGITGTVSQVGWITLSNANGIVYVSTNTTKISLGSFPTTTSAKMLVANSGGSYAHVSVTGAVNVASTGITTYNQEVPGTLYPLALTNALNAVGTGTGLVSSVAERIAYVKTLTPGANVTITDQGTNIVIASSGGGGTTNLPPADFAWGAESMEPFGTVFPPLNRKDGTLNQSFVRPFDDSTNETVILRGSVPPNLSAGGNIRFRFKTYPTVPTVNSGIFVFTAVTVTNNQSWDSAVTVRFPFPAFGCVNTTNLYTHVEYVTNSAAIGLTNNGNFFWTLTRSWTNADETVVGDLNLENFEAYIDVQ